MNYRNKQAEDDNVDPRQQLEEFVFGYFGHITQDRRQKIIDIHRLRGVDEREQLKEFVHTKNPYDVLKECFSPGRLHVLADSKYQISPDSGLEDHELVGVILNKLGYRNEVKPAGLSQIRNDIDQPIKDAANVAELSITDIKGICSYMAEVMEDLLSVLLLFHIGALQTELYERQPEEPANTELTGKSDLEDEHKIEDSLTDICKRYKKKRTLQMGHIVGFISELMDIFQNNNELKKYCQKNFRCEVPVSRNQLGQIRLFTAYRNIITHSRENLNWEQNKCTAETGLSTMEKDSDTHAIWQKTWNSIVDAFNLNRDFPKGEMIQIMAIFMGKFLDSLSKGIYPKVIVMRSYEIDEYGSVKIHADSSDPNDKGGISLTGYDYTYFVTNTFTELFYHSRTNPVGIEAILAPRNDLLKWATNPTDKIKKEKEK